MTKDQIAGQLRALLLAIGSMALASCARDTPVPPRAIPAPVQSAAVTPAVDAVRADSAKGREISGRLETQVDALRKSSSDADTAIPTGGFYRTVAGGRTIFVKP